MAYPSCTAATVVPDRAVAVQVDPFEKQILRNHFLSHFSSENSEGVLVGDSYTLTSMQQRLYINRGIISFGNCMQLVQPPTRRSR
jgi:hypothetical protein